MCSCECDKKSSGSGCSSEPARDREVTYHKAPARQGSRDSTLPTLSSYNSAKSSMTPTHGVAHSMKSLGTESLREQVYHLQRQLIQKDSVIHRLKMTELVSEQDERKKQQIKKGFSVIEHRNVDTSTIDTVLRDSTNHMLYTLSETWLCRTGFLLLDVPYNDFIGATNSDMRVHKMLKAFWKAGAVTASSDIAEDSHSSRHVPEASIVLTPRGDGTLYETKVPVEALQAKLQDLSLFRDVIVQKAGRVYSSSEISALNQILCVGNDEGVCESLRQLLVCPVIVESTTIALVLLYNNNRGQGDMPDNTEVPDLASGINAAYAPLPHPFVDGRDPRLLQEILPEVWTSNVNPLLNIAIETVRHKQTEEELSYESDMRDEIILHLDEILDEVQRHLTARAKHYQHTSSYLWKCILQRVANFFQDFFESDCLIGVTNTPANFRIHDGSAKSEGTATPYNLPLDVPAARSPKMRSPSAGSSTGLPPPTSQQAEGTSHLKPLEELVFLHYVFCDALKTIKGKSGLSTPELQHSKVMLNVIGDRKPFYTEDCSKQVSFPCGHMNVSNMLLVPIIFCDEPVGMLGLANGSFSVSSGRILQSVFTTFWSMIVKATLMTESQKVLDAALPAQISERLRVTSNIADSYSAATTLFADVVGFTEFTRELHPWEVVEFCNLIFARLDTLTQHFGLEMIQVIGDCYMCAGGIQDKSGRAPDERGKMSIAQVRDDSQMTEIVDFALCAMMEADKINYSIDSLDVSKRLKEMLKNRPVYLRIGIAEGPLMAGIFGTVKMQYDVLGDTVSLAAQLEHTSRPSGIHVNETFYQALKEDADYIFETLKPMTLRGLNGLHQTYMISGTASKRDALKTMTFRKPSKQMTPSADTPLPTHVIRQLKRRLPSRTDPRVDPASPTYSGTDSMNAAVGRTESQRWKPQTSATP